MTYKINNQEDAIIETLTKKLTNNFSEEFEFDYSIRRPDNRARLNINSNEVDFSLIITTNVDDEKEIIIKLYNNTKLDLLKNVKSEWNKEKTYYIEYNIGMKLLLK